MKSINNFLHGAKFDKSAAKLNQLPADEGIEVAFAGRSNAGKSSALNTITGQNKLARISKTPGRTQLINLFTLDSERRLVDLPGYGYAKVPERVKLHWQQLLDSYLNQRVSLRGLILLMDVRHPLKEFDQIMLEWAIHRDMPVHILLTKADKLKNGPARNTLLTVQKELDEYQNISLQLFSSHKKQGLAEAHRKLEQWFFEAPKKSPLSNGGLTEEGQDSGN